MQTLPHLDAMRAQQSGTPALQHVIPQPAGEAARRLAAAALLVAKQDEAPQRARRIKVVQCRLACARRSCSFYHGARA